MKQKSTSTEIVVSDRAQASTDTYMTPIDKGEKRKSCASSSLALPPIESRMDTDDISDGEERIAKQMKLSEKHILSTDA